jgi:NADH dehydrogenase FAD-containing subunit
MSTKIVVLGAGVSGHTAALFVKKLMGDKAEVHVISPLPYYNWIPSNILKRLLHTLFIYKAKAKLLWWIIPE